MFKKYTKNLLAVILVVVLAIVLLPAPQIARGDVSSAAAYLKTKSPNPWITMALVSVGESPDADYLKTTTANSAIDLEAPILALTSLGKNPRTFPNTDLVAALKNFHASNQIGDPALLNDDVFGVLALLSAGESKREPVIQDSKNFIIQHQNSDGGWSFAVGGSSDTNITSVAIMALLEAGVPEADASISKAVSYLKNAQNSDGGFPYDPQSQFGTNSDSSSDSWVISAIYKLGENPTNWTKNGNNPVGHLLSLQVQQGYFDDGFGDNQFTAISTSYAVIALSGKSYPVSAGADDVGVPLVGYRIEGSSGSVCSGDIDAPNPLELVKIVASECGFTYTIEDTSFGPYLSKIGNDAAKGVSGWLYAVNFVTPSIGAADYVLAAGDLVIWHYGNFDWQPAGETAEVPLTATILAGDNNEDRDEVTFEVTTANGGSLSFGQISPGGSSSQTVTLKNRGTKNLYIESVVNGDDVFKSYIYIDNAGWRDFNTQLAAGAVKDSSVKLDIPSAYSKPGAKNGTLIFWGVPAP